MLEILLIIVSTFALVYIIYADRIIKKLSRLFNRINNADTKLAPVKDTDIILTSTTPISQLVLDKQLYYQLQNLEQYPEARLLAYNRLISLFDAVIDEAHTSSTQTILTAVPTFSQQVLKEYLDGEYNDVLNGYEAYLQRRKGGGARELLPDFEYAKYYLRIAAAVNYVDGAWLGGIHRITTNQIHLPSTRIAWQVLSEEMGDGDLKKNHVWLYRELLKSINADDIGMGDSKEFISSSKNPNNDARVWRAALAQLCISIFPDEFLPEILGFNMAYESLPLHLLITIYELRELNIDPYYFILHVCIDNKHTGHAAMGILAVTSYIESLPLDEQLIGWKRVQAGFLLAFNLPTTPIPRSELDKSVEQIFGQKTTATPHILHKSCPAKIGGRTGKKLSEWLDQKLYSTHSLAFLRALANSQWIVRGNPEKSKLIRETKWGGRMFGAFNINEVAVIEEWIRELASDDQLSKCTGSYEALTNVVANPPNIRVTRNLSEILTHPSAPRHQVISSENDLFSSSVLRSTAPQNSSHSILSLLSISFVPFEYVPSLPSKCADIYGATAIKCLRALHGFLPESDVCAGMHEVTSNKGTLSVFKIAHVTLSEVNDSVREFVELVLCLSAHPIQNEAILVGLQIGFLDYVFPACCQLNDLTSDNKKRLTEIRRRCSCAIDELVNKKCENEKWMADMSKGRKIVEQEMALILN